MASGSNNLTSYKAKQIIGSSVAASPAGALLFTGANYTGDTWIYHYGYGGTTSPWGIRHDTQASKIIVKGNGTDSFWIKMNTGDTYIYGKVGIGYDPNTAQNNYKLYVDGNVYFDDTTYLNGNVGIGYDPATSGNTYKLYVDGSAYFNIGTNDNTTDLKFVINGNGRYLALGAGGIQARTSADAVNTLYLNYNGGTTYVGGNSYLVGSVGIGYNPDTSGNTYKLYVSGDTNITGTTTFGDYLYRAYTASSQTPMIWMNGSDFDNYLWQIGCGTENGKQYYGYALKYIGTGSGVANYLQLIADNQNGTDVVAIGVNQSGQVGIGTNASTDYRLYVSGTSYFSDTVTHNGDIVFVSTGGSGTTGTSKKITWSGSTDAADIYYYVPSSDQGNLIINTRDDTNCLVAFAYNGTIKAYINNSTPSFYPATTNTGTIGTSTYEWGNTYTRIIYARHFDASYPFTTDRNMYYGYNKGANHYFYSMDGTTRTHLATLSTDFTVQNGYLKSTKNGNTVQIGSQNTGYCHITNSANIPFWFNKDIWMEKGKTIGAAGTQYRPFQLYLGRNSTAGSNAINAANPLIEFSNSDRSQYGQLIYTDYDSVRAPDGLTWVGNQANSWFQAPRVFGAVWNDYAEYRETKEEIQPGRCVVETGRGDLILSTERLQAGCEIVSDTFGFAIGETATCKTPTACAGRVLAYLYEDNSLAKPGDPVCSGPDGTVSLMTHEEEIEWPSRIIATVSEIPDYEEWEYGSADEFGNKEKLKVNGRIWIRIR